MVYVAFLRGVNVGGNSLVSMAAIKEALEDLGFSEVRTYMNSGNVIFSTSATDAQKLASRIEKALEARTGMPIKVLVWYHAALKKLVNAIPAEWVDGRLMRCYVMLLWKEIDSRKILAQLPTNPAIEDVVYLPGAVVWRIDRKNVNKSRMTTMIGTPIYKQITMRSINTIRKLMDLIA